MVTISSSEEEHTIFSTEVFSTEEDEPENLTPKSSEKEIGGSGEAQPSVGAVKSGRKRLSEETSTKVNSKRSKGGLFSEEDEIVLLQGVIDSKAHEGKNPFDDKRGFYESMKGFLSFDATFDQFRNKIRYMKKRYTMNENSGYEQAYFSNPHQQKFFRLSKAIWGTEGIAVESAISSSRKQKESERRLTKKLHLASSPNGKKIEDDRKRGNMEESPLSAMESNSFENSFFLGMDFLKEKWTKVPIETKKITQEKMEKLQADELECQELEEVLKDMKDQCANKKVELLNEVTSLIMAAK